MILNAVLPKTDWHFVIDDVPWIYFPSNLVGMPQNHLPYTNDHLHHFSVDYQYQHTIGWCFSVQVYQVTTTPQ